MIAFRAAGVALVVGVLTARSAGGQNPPLPLPPPAAADTTPKPTLPVNGLLLRPQHLHYEMAVVMADSTHVIGQRDIDVRSTTYDALPAWLVLEARTGIVPSSDTIYLSNLGLQPLKWISALGAARLAIDFTPDSVLGATSGAPGRRTFALANRGDLLAGAAMTELALPLMPLAVGRQDSVTMLLVDLGTSVIVPATITVEGEEDLVTALGRVHCWVVAVQAGAAASRIWVSQANPVVVRTRQVLPGRPGAMFQQELTQRR